MATSTFERKIVISNPESLQRLERVMADQTPKNRFRNILFPAKTENGVKHY